MKKETNYTPIVLTITLIIVVAIIGGYYINKSSNNNSNGPPVQSVQEQCEAKVKEKYDSVVAEFTPTLKGEYGAKINVADYYSHYNKSINECVFSVHMSLSPNNNPNSQLDVYFLFSIDKNNNKEQIGLLWYGTDIGSAPIIVQCVVNSLPCTSIDEYTRLTTPYLNN